MYKGVWSLWLSCSPLCRPGGLQCLLAVLKLLMNLTHESDLGSHRVREQKGIMTAILNIILKVRRAYLPSFSTLIRSLKVLKFLSHKL